MGTRCDFYTAGSLVDSSTFEWIGSIGYDGFPDDLKALEATSKESFIELALGRINEGSDGSLPEHGWPWPWENSLTSDYALVWCDDTVYVLDRIGERYNKNWLSRDDWNRMHEDEEAYEEAMSAWARDPDDDTPEPVRPPYPEGIEAKLPDMTSVQNVTLGARSGLMVLKP